MATEIKTVDHKYRLADFCTEIFVLTLHLRSKSDYGDPVLLRQRIISHLKKMEQKARHHKKDKGLITKAKFALVAFIDESIISSDWINREVWLEKPLQLQLFNRFDAGEKFFDMLNEEFVLFDFV